MKNMFVRVSASTLLVFLMLFSVVVPVESQSIAFQIMGYVTVDGVPTNGVNVSGSPYPTRNDANGHAGFYALMPPGVTNGSQVTINFEYNGHTTSVTVTANGNSAVATTANIVTIASTPTPAPGGSGGNPGSGGSGGVTQTPTPTLAPTMTPTPTPSIGPTITPTPTPMPPTSTPTATPGTNNTPIYLAIVAIVIIGIVAAAYFLLKKK